MWLDHDLSQSPGRKMHLASFVPAAASVKSSPADTMRLAVFAGLAKRSHSNSPTLRMPHHLFYTV